jgi:hypothetical protein
MNTDNGALSFTELLDNKQFIGAISENERRIKGMSDATVAAGAKMDKTFESMSAQAARSVNALSNSSKREIGLLADIEKSLEQLKEKRKNAFTIEDIEKYNKKIQETEQHLKEYNSVGRVSVEVHEKQNSALSGIATTLGKWAIGLVTVTGLVKLFKGILESTTDSAHVWETKIAQAKSILDVFMKSVATADFSNFNERIRNAASSAKLYVEEMEYVANVHRQYKLQELDLQKQLSEQREIAYQNDTVSNKEKIAALDNVLTLVQKKADLEIEIAQKTQEAIADKTVGINKITKEELVYAVENYDKLVQVGQKYNALTDVLTSAEKWKSKGINYSPVTLDPEFLKKGIYKATAKGGDFAITEESIAKLKKQIADLGPDAAKLGAIESMFGEVNSKEREAVFNSLVAIKEATNEVYAERRLIVRRKATLENEEADLLKKAAKDAQDIAKQIKEQQELLNQAISKGNSSDIKAIGEKIAALQKELDLRERITKQVVDAMQFQGFVPTLSETGQLKEPVFGSHAKVKEKTPEQISLEMGKMAPSSVGWAKQMNRDLEDYNKGLIKEEELHKRIFEHAVRFTAELGRQMGLSEQQQQVLGSTLDMFTSLAEGGPAGYVGAAVSLFSTLMAAIPSQAAKFQAQIDLINKSLEKQQQLIALSARIGGGQEARQGDLDLLNKKKAANDAQMAKDQKIMNSWIDFFGSKERAQADYNKRLEEGAIIDADILKSQQDYAEFITGGMTEMSIADSIAQGFEDGKSSAADFADTFNDFMRTAINGALEDMLKPDVAAWYKKFAEYMTSDGGLNPWEVADLKIDWDKIIKNGEANREALYKITGISPSDGTLSQPSSLTSTIQRSITEDTATEWVGLIRKQADDIRVTRDYSKLSVDRLIGIENNTLNTVTELQKLNVKTDQVISNTNKVYSGLGG